MNYNVSVKPYALNNVNPSTGLLPSAIDSLTYTSFESVNTISESPYSASFIYNPDEERAKMEVSQGGSVILSRWYTSSGYIKEISAGVTKEYTFIGGDAYTAPVLAIKQNGSAPTWDYLLRDHPGSITYVVNASNNTTLYEYNYDAWGRMRDPTNWEPYAPSQIAQSNPFVAGRGFTGHEHLPWFSMINMNGRLYDPLTGQFLSPDNNVQLPDFTQNLNRYSYCLNNPLKYTDPDGEWVITALTMLANMYVSTSAANDWQFNPVKWDWRNVKTWSSLVHSGISGYRMGSSLESIISNNNHKINSEEFINDSNSKIVSQYTDGISTYYPGNEVLSPIEDYGDVKGLTVSQYYGFNIDPDRPGYVTRGGGIVVDVSYSSPNVKGAKWTQFIITDKPTRNRSIKGYYDSLDGSIFYPYQDNNNIIAHFYDAPTRITDCSWEAVLSLVRNHRSLVKLYYGFRIIDGVTSIFPIKIILP